MRFLVSLATFATVCFVLAPHAQASRVHHGPTAAHRAKAAKIKKVHGQRQIDSNRATEIQAALIRAHYLDGEPTGQWDANTEAAMRKMQADNGWQTKITPDSRALIKLGLGPDHSSDLGAANSVSMSRAPATGSTNTAAISAKSENP